MNWSDRLIINDSVKTTEPAVSPGSSSFFDNDKLLDRLDSMKRDDIRSLARSFGLKTGGLTKKQIQSRVKDYLTRGSNGNDNCAAVPVNDGFSETINEFITKHALHEQADFIHRVMNAARECSLANQKLLGESLAAWKRAEKVIATANTVTDLDNAVNQWIKTEQKRDGQRKKNHDKRLDIIWNAEKLLFDSNTKLYCAIHASFRRLLDKLAPAADCDAMLPAVSIDFRYHGDINRDFIGHLRESKALEIIKASVRRNSVNKYSIYSPAVKGSTINDHESISAFITGDSSKSGELWIQLPHGHVICGKSVKNSQRVVFRREKAAAFDKKLSSSSITAVYRDLDRDESYYLAFISALTDPIITKVMGIAKGHELKPVDSQNLFDYFLDQGGSLLLKDGYIIVESNDHFSCVSSSTVIRFLKEISRFEPDHCIDLDDALHNHGNDSFVDPCQSDTSVA